MSDVEMLLLCNRFHVALETHQTTTGKLLRQDAQEAKHDELEERKYIKSLMCVCSMSSELNTIMSSIMSSKLSTIMSTIMSSKLSTIMSSKLSTTMSIKQSTIISTKLSTIMSIKLSNVMSSKLSIIMSSIVRKKMFSSPGRPSSRVSWNPLTRSCLARNRR